MAKVIEDTKNLDLTEKEQAEGAKLLWLDEKTALYKIIECINNLQVSTYENIYYSKFIVFRDTKILNYYLRNK